MTKRYFVSGVVCAVGFTPFFLLLQAATPRNSDSHVRAAVFARLPLSFEANRGQTDAHVRFLSHGNGYTLFLTGDETVLRLAGRARSSHTATSGTAGGLLPSVNLTREAPSHRSSTNVPAEVLRMRLLHANTSATVTGSDELPGKSNYFIGNDPKNWRTDVETFAQVKYSNVYAGIDIVYYGNQGQLENDFVVAPGADPKNIQISLTRQSDAGHSPGDRTRVSQDASGDLIINTLDSSVTLRKPVAYQMDNSGIRHLVSSGYVLRAQGPAEKGWIISFQVPSYDRSKALVIDPVLAYSSYLGGSGVDASSTVEVAVDSTGSAYVAGSTLSTDYPTTPGAVQPSFGGAGAPDCSGNASDCGDAVLTKINPTGTAIVYSTYLGGSNGDTVYGLAVDSAGNAYLAGSTQSSNFPTTAGAFQSSLNKGLGAIVCAASGNPYGTTGICADMFVAKIDPTGSKLIYSTLLGGSGSEQPQGVVVDQFGNAYVTGATDSADFPTTTGAFRTTAPCSSPVCSNAMVSKLSADGSHLIYSTYLGNGATNAFAIAVDSAGEAYVDGWVNVTPLSFPTTASAYQTAQNIPSTGCTTFQPFWATHCNDGFLTKLDSAGSTLLYSTIIGGTGNEFLNGVALDAAGDAYITGFTNSPDFPVTPGAFQTTFPGSICQASSWWGAYCSDGFVSKFDPSKSGAASLVYSTFLGGSGNQGGNIVVVDSRGNAYVSGSTSSLDFPLVAPLQDALADGVNCNSSSSAFSGSCADAFVAELNATGSALIFSTYLGGSNVDNADFMAIDSFDNIYVAGSTRSSDFPTTPGVFQPVYGGASDFFIAKIASVTVVGLEPPLAALVTVGSPVPEPGRAFQQGSTLPLKLQLYHGTTLLTGTAVAPPQITAIVRSGDPVNLTTIDPDSGQANDNGTLFRNSGSDWIFNLSTKGLSTGSYTLTITVAGTQYDAAFVLR